MKLTALAAVPLVLAGVALALPAIDAHATMRGVAGSFSGSWTLLGWESVAGLTAFALAALLVALTATQGRGWQALLGLAACAVWPWSLSTPMHVLTGWLPIGIEQYYGTEYASIDFTRVLSPVMVAAMVACGAGFAALIISDTRRRTRAAAPIGK